MGMKVDCAISLPSAERGGICQMVTSNTGGVGGDLDARPVPHPPRKT